MNKQYTLIVGHGFSLSNDTDSNVQSDYNPEIWGIKTKKSALKFSRQILAEGDKIRVTDYNNPAFHALANEFIKELGLSQPLFKEPEAIKQALVTNGMPRTLAELKRYLAPGKKIIITNYMYDGTENTRETFVRKVQSSNFTVDKNGRDSWVEFDKASNWLFTNESATRHYVNNQGLMSKGTKITYINQ